MMSGFGDHEFYPDLIDKASVLTWRLTWNLPLPDGNKRAALAAHELNEEAFATWLGERVEVI